MALKIENLTGGYSGINVIKNVNLTIEPGQAVGLIGLMVLVNQQQLSTYLDY